MSSLAVRVNELGKRFRIGAQDTPYQTFRETLVGLGTAPYRALRRAFARESAGRPAADNSSEFIWALRNISLDVAVGEVVGVIGRNGAGKSTLLKVLSRITRPTTGWAKVRGRVGSLLEVGTGFHPELTGRENVYLNGAILGMRRSEIRRKFDEIIAFAEVERFVSTPVKHYSSGMHMRLAFAVAAHLEPEILVVDEVLAVGDAAFQRKCLGKMDQVAKAGRTVLFVSHNLVAVGALCSRAILLERGLVTADGNVHDVIDQYTRSLVASLTFDLRQRADRKGDGKLRFTEVLLLDDNFAPIHSVVSGQHVNIAAAYETRDHECLNNVSVSIAISDALGIQLTNLDNTEADQPFATIPPRGYFVCSIPRFPLVSGFYTVNLFCRVSATIADWLVQAAGFGVELGDFFGTGRNADREQSMFLVHHGWRLMDAGAFDLPGRGPQ